MPRKETQHETVKVALRRTYGFEGRYYGPGSSVEVPKPLAVALGADEVREDERPPSDPTREAPRIGDAEEQGDVDERDVVHAGEIGRQQADEQRDALGSHDVEVGLVPAYEADRLRLEQQGSDTSAADAGGSTSSRSRGGSARKGGSRSRSRRATVKRDEAGE